MSFTAELRRKKQKTILNAYTAEINLFAIRKENSDSHVSMWIKSKLKDSNTTSKEVAYSMLSLVHRTGLTESRLAIYVTNCVNKHAMTMEFFSSLYSHTFQFSVWHFSREVFRMLDSLPIRIVKQKNYHVVDTISQMNFLNVDFVIKASSITSLVHVQYNLHNVSFKCFHFLYTHTYLWF